MKYGALSNQLYKNENNLSTNRAKNKTFYIKGCKFSFKWKLFNSILT